MISIKEVVEKINALIDTKDFKPHEVMQLSQAAVNLANAGAVINNVKGVIK